MSKAVLAWLGVLFVAAGGTFIWLGIKYSLAVSDVGVSVREIDRDYQRVPPSASDVYLSEFTLTERSGRQVGTADLTGRVSVTNFFFANCMAECLTQNRAFEQVQKEYGPQGVQFLSITCDPQNDTPSGLQKYVADKRFDIANNGEAWWFLTGDLNYIQRVAGEYYNVVLKRFTHTEKFVVHDKWGNPRGSFSWKDSASLADLKLTLDKLLVEKEPPPEVKQAAEERKEQIAQAQARADAAAAEAKQAADKAAESTSPAEAP